MVQKPSFVPQVIDLEEEEKQKELQKIEKPDIVILPLENDGVDPSLALSSEKDSGAWEGSLPLIASVQSVSDINMTELIGSPEVISSDSVEKIPLCENTLPLIKQPSTTKSIPDLVPISTGSVELNKDMPQEKEGEMFRDTSPGSGAKTGLLQLQDQPLYFVPTALRTTTKTTSTLPKQATSSPGMRTFKLNQSSGRVFGDCPKESLKSITRRPLTSPVLSPESSQSAVLESSTSGKLNVMHTKVIPGSSGYTLSIPENNSSYKDESSSSMPKTNDATIQTRRVLLPATTAVRAAMQTKPGENTSTIVNQNFATSSTPGSKMLYIPVSSSCLSKMVFVPTVSGGPSPRVMLLPTIPSSSSGIDKMKMVLVPSTQDSGKMILLPASTETNEGIPVNMPILSGPSEKDKKKMLVLPPPVLGNFISKSPPTIEQRSKLMLPRPTIINDSPSFQSSGTIKNTGALPQMPDQLNEISSAEKTEDNIGGPEFNRENSDQDNSDDVVVIGPVTNSLTITRVRTASESTFPRLELNPRSSCTSPSLLIVPAPVSSGTAETNVVSSLTTISSIIPETTVMPQKDLGINESNPSSSSEDMVIVKTSLNSVQLNALLQSTHKELLRNEEDGCVVSSSKSLNSEEMLNEEKMCENKHNKDHGEASAAFENPVETREEKGNDDIEEVECKQVPIKKGGHHWSAVDLSLNFKSVKLEWLLGTIRKNVLMNIYRMSLKTLSPVTLSVKNGTSTSMLYGLARRGVQKDRDHLMPILILGSVVSAIMSSSTTPDATLFQANAIKYFIRENTGELSSYTYDASGDFLVKLASKKRGDGGEMIGIGEKVPIQKLRELSSVENSFHQTLTNKTDTGKAEEKSCTQPLKSKVQDCTVCSCTVAGDFICMGHSTPQLKEKDPTVSAANCQAVADSPQSVPLEQSCIILQETVTSSKSILPQELPVKESNTKPLSEVEHQECSSMSASAFNNLSTSLSPQLKECPTTVSDADSVTSGRKPSLDSNNFSLVSIGTQCKEPKAVVSHEISHEEETLIDIKSLINCEEKNESKLHHSPKGDKNNEKNLPVTSLNIIGIKGLDAEETSCDPAKGIEEAQESNVEEECEDIDIVGDCYTNVSMSSVLRQQMTNEGTQGNGSRTRQAKTSGEVARTLLTPYNLKRKIDSVFRSFERPCPRSKKRSLNPVVGKTASPTSSKLKSTTGVFGVLQTKSDESSPIDSSARLPSHLAHLRQSSSSSERAIVPEEEPKPGPSKVKVSPTTIKFNVIPGKRKLGKNVIRLKKKEVKYVDVEGNHEERNSFVHNELERMRRRVIRHLFINLQLCVASVPSSPLMGETASQPKITILNAASKVCSTLRLEEMKLRTEEEKIRRDRSLLIKKLASVIADTPEVVRLRWRRWVRDFLQNPTAKQTFEKQWKPTELEKDLMTVSSGESSLDMDVDEGSPLPVPRKQMKLKKPEKNTKKGKKKLGRPYKIIVDSKYNDMNISPETATSIPTSILLMAGTSSRGRKIVRKEDMMFVSS
ncbi:hypothetical protein OTU49_003979 [Cherax quadricarinatus]